MSEVVAAADFDVMDAEWQRIMSRPSFTHAALSEWDADMGNLCREHDDLVRTGRWVVGPEDMLSIIGRARYEAHHSAMLAWLLDPLGKHGLGATLLASLLRLCGVVDRPDLHRARPALEVQRSDTRADIVVFATGATLVIENKVNAGEQERQCDRLYEHFGIDPGAVFLFLTPTGRAPDTATGTCRDVWVRLSYKDLMRQIDEALRNPEANAGASGRLTAMNYLMTLRREFT